MTRVLVKNRLLTLILLFISHLLPAQTLLQGRVTDAATGKPLSFATVYINTTTRGTTANEDGQFKLTGVPAGTVEVVASYLGYKQARSIVKLRPNSPLTVNLVLSPTGNSLDDVTITAKRSKAWERQFRRFKAELLGESPFTGRCVLVNEQAVVLTEEDGHLKGRATEPLVFENNALGYRIHYDLLSFDTYQRATYYAGATRFEELTPDSPQQLKRWQRNRQQAYIGSTRHLIASMVAKTHEQEGYLIFKSNIDIKGQATAMAPMLTFDGDRPRPAQMDSIFQSGDLPAERLMFLDNPLEIFYTRVNARNSPYRDMPYAYSMLLLPNKSALVTTDGWVSTPNGMEIRGYLSKDRLANLLPADWRPDATTAQPQTGSEGTILPPDARLDSLKRDWKQYQKTLLPTVYLHTDKAFYTTGDNLWFSAYVLNMTTLSPVPNRYADVDESLHLDWVAPSGRTIHHQWVSVKNGRAEGVFQLPDSLQTGAYTLRAYTEAGRTARRPAFEKTTLVSNGLSNLNDQAITATQPQTVSATQLAPTKQPEPKDLALDATADTTGISVRIRASGLAREQPVYLTIQSRDRFVGQAKIKLLDSRARVNIPAFNIPAGLTRLTLFDAAGKPKAERLVSVSSLPGEPVRVALTADKPQYAPRDMVTLQLTIQDDTGDPLPAFLSASVTDADQLPADSVGASLQTYLLNKPLIDNTLLLKQKPIPADTSVGIVLRGRAVDAKGRAVPNAKVLLSFVGMTDSFARSAQADGQGRFQMDALALTDTARINIQVMDADFKQTRATIRLDSPTGPLGTGNNWPVDSSAAPDWNRYLKSIQLARLRQAEDAERYRFNGARQLKEVMVKAARIDDSEARRVSLHGTPDGSVVFKQEDANRYANVFEMLQGKLPGVQVNFNALSGTYNVVVRGVGSFGSNNAPLFLRDGQVVDQELLLTTNPSEIERIEVVKNSGATIYGARGGAGVIAFFTRKWKPDQLNPGGKQLTVTGYPLPRMFTFPAYNTDSTTQIDRRDVLLWQPQFQTDAQGQTTLKFPLSDVVKTLRVTIQGITATGQPVSVERLVKVQ